MSNADIRRATHATRELERRVRRQDLIRRKVAAVVKLCPDYYEILETDRFLEWLMKQPMKVKKLGRSLKARDQLKFINLYKRDVAGEYTTND